MCRVRAGVRGKTCAPRQQGLKDELQRERGTHTHTEALALQCGIGAKGHTQKGPTLCLGAHAEMGKPATFMLRFSHTHAYRCTPSPKTKSIWRSSEPLLATLAPPEHRQTLEPNPPSSVLSSHPKLLCITPENIDVHCSPFRRSASKQNMLHTCRSSDHVRCGCDMALFSHRSSESTPPWSRPAQVF